MPSSTHSLLVCLCHSLSPCKLFSTTLLHQTISRLTKHHVKPHSTTHFITYHRITPHLPSQHTSPTIASNLITAAEPRHLEWLIDLTILYPKGDALSIFDLICRRRVEPLRVVVVARKYNIKQLLNLHSEELQAAFFQIWRQKDAMLEAYYKEGVIRVEPLRLTESRKGQVPQVNGGWPSVLFVLVAYVVANVDYTTMNTK